MIALLGRAILAIGPCFFMTLNVFCQSLLACKVSFEISADGFMGSPLLITNCFSLAAFKIIYLEPLVF